MLSIQNDMIGISCYDNGAGLAVTDLKRKQKWLLDEKSLGFTRPNHNAWGNIEAPIEVFSAVSARQVDPGRLVITYQADEAQFNIEYCLRDRYIEVVLPTTKHTTIGAVTLPGSFLPANHSSKILLPIMQGMLWDGRGPSFSLIRGEGSHHGFSMAFAAYLGKHGGLLVTAETRDDCRWWFGKDAEGRFWVTNLQISSLGMMRYPRLVRLYVTDPDIPAIAQEYRKKMQIQGQIKTWNDKITECPSLDRIFGSLMCFIGYCQDDDLDYVTSCRKLKSYGFERVLLYPNCFNIYYPDIRMGGVPAINLSHDTVDAIKTLGYDVAPWSWLNEALKKSNEDILLGLRRGPDSQVIQHWAIDDQQWYLMCYSYLAGYQKQALQSNLSDITWDHFDVLSCVPPMECHATNHPLHPGRPSSRSEDREWVRAVFRTDRERGLIVSSENFNDAYIRDQDFGSVRAWPQYGPWPFWPVPLTMLVYHDCMIHSWWEIHSYNDPWGGRTAGCGGLYEYGGGRPRLMAALDALMGCPPQVFPFGAQYGYTGRGKESFLYRFRFEDPEVQLALKAALPVAQLHKRIGKLQIIDFKILSEDGYLQESTFADGTRVVANFSRDFALALPDGVPVEPHGWLVVE